MESRKTKQTQKISYRYREQIAGYQRASGLGARGTGEKLVKEVNCIVMDGN